MAKKKPKNSENVQIDKKDIEIIKHLEDDGRMSILKLAKKVNLSHETVRYRLNKLKKSGVIKKFIVRVDKRKLGFMICAIIMVSLWNYTKEDWEKFLNYLQNEPSIYAVEKVTGDFDLKFAFWSRTPEEMDTISSDIKTKFSRIIKDWNSFIFTKEYKWKELPF